MDEIGGQFHLDVLLFDHPADDIGRLLDHHFHEKRIHQAFGDAGVFAEEIVCGVGLDDDITLFFRQVRNQITQVFEPVVDDPVYAGGEVSVAAPFGPGGLFQDQDPGPEFMGP